MKECGAFPSYRCPSPFGSTDIEPIQQTKVFLQRAGARPWSLGANLDILVKPNEKRDGIRNEPRLVKLEGFRGHSFVEQILQPRMNADESSERW